MILVLVLILILAWCILFFKRRNIEEYTRLMIIVGLGIVTTAVFIFAGIAIFTIANARVYDQKIAIYEEDNKSIEDSLILAVGQSLSCTDDVSCNLTTENVISEIIANPELSAEELVKNQVDLYMQNREKITSLKLDQIEISTVKWLLYFGK